MNKSPTENKDLVSQGVDEPFSEETIRSLQELGEAIRQIHNRLVAEGYVIKNGLILKRPEPDKKNNGGNDQ
jgi:hypothetical protein